MNFQENDEILVREEQAFFDCAWETLRNAIDTYSSISASSGSDQHTNRVLRNMFDNHAKGLRDVGDDLISGSFTLRDSEEMEENLHLGVVGLETHLGIIVDWRAPLATAFYSRQTTDGQDVIKRRTIKVVRHTVESVSEEIFQKGSGTGKKPLEKILLGKPFAQTFKDDQSSINETIGANTELRALDHLLGELKSNRDGHMRTAVATIQSDQDRAIRSPIDQPLIIEGGPGTGKTVVGLHRVAKIIYDLRVGGQDQRLLFIGPNKHFSEYISRVLPTLGEDATITKDFPSLCIQSVNFQEIDIAALKPESNAQIAKVKGDLLIAKIIREVAWLRARVVPLQLRVDGLLIKFQREEILELMDRARLMFLNDESSYTSVRQFVTDQITARSQRKLREARDVAQSISIDRRERKTTPTSPIVKNSEDTSHSTLQRVTDSEDYLVATIGTGRQQLTFAKVVAQLLPDIYPLELIQQMLTGTFDLGSLNNAASTLILNQVIHRDVRAPWTLEDLPLIDEANFIIAGPQVRFRHIVVDEAQDYSPMGWRTISRRIQANSITILGDPNQSTTLGAVTTWEGVLQQLQIDDADFMALDLSYRVPAPILDFARKSIPRESAIRYPVGLRSGSEPEILKFKSPLSAPQVAEVLGTTIEGEFAVIVTTDSSMRSLEDEWEDTAVLHPSDIKGLEFDVAIVVEPGDWCDESDHAYRRLFIALTRPTKRLVVMHHRPLPNRLHNEKR